jgi:hypothetical protein
MVRYINAVVTVYAESNSMNADGDYIQEFSQVENIEGDVQPHSLTDEEIKLYGLSESKGQVKLFLYNGLHPNIKTGNRAVVQSALTGKTDIYSIMPVNCWSSHGECLLVPIENETFSQPTPEPNGEGVENGNGD